MACPTDSVVMPGMVSDTAAALMLGALKLSGITRAFAAIGIGLAPILFQIANQESIAWQTVVGTLGTLTLITGLILRTRCPHSRLSRIIVTVGAMAILALVLIPQNGAMPIKALVDQVANLPGKAKVMPLLMHSGLVYILVVLLALTAWLPGTKNSGSSVFTWALLFWGLISAIALLLVGDEILATLKVELLVTFYQPLAYTGWMTMACFGIASIVGQRIR